MIRYSYTLLPHDMPRGMDNVLFIETVVRAMRYVEKCSAGRVRFLNRPTIYSEDLFPAAMHVNIGWEELTVKGRVAEQLDRDGVKSIAFDPRVKWGTNWWHMMFTRRPFLFTLAVHELGHLLGLEHNLDDDESVMSPGPVFSEFTPREIEQLRKL